MYAEKLKDHLRSELEDIREAGLHKAERIIETPQAARVEVGNQVN